MRQPKRHEAKDGTITWRVRYRSGGQESSETFRRRDDAERFAELLGSGRGDRVKEALEWLAAKQGGADDDTTFGEFFDAWVDDKTGITERTRADYKAIRRRHLTSLDTLPLSLITRTHISAIVRDMERGKDPKSAKTIKHAINLLSTVLAIAQDDGLIPRNPVKRVTLPKVRSSDSDYLFLTHEEAGRLLSATPDDYKPFVTFLLGTGCRWSEATALQIRHVDFANGTVRVERAWKRIPGGWEVGPPKSEKSRRTINAAVPALAAAHAVAGKRKPTELLFTTPRGGVIRHANFYNRVWVPACKTAGLVDPRPTIHDCRSTFGSWLISEGIGLEAVQDQLGHESYETTRRIYAHLLPAVGVAAGKAASAALARALASVGPVPELANGGVRRLEAVREPD